MKPITQAYHFEKFWQVYSRQSRYCSKWDHSRTDMAVFINRTLSTWFAGKYFQIIMEDKVQELKRRQYIDVERWLGKTVPEREFKPLFTMYVLITGIEFSYGSCPIDKITFYYAEPHSHTIQEMSMGLNELSGISLQEDQESFIILRKFYPVTKEKIEPLPRI